MFTVATWIWFKAGDRLDEGSSLIAKFVSEVGQGASLAKVSIRLGHAPDGKAITLLVADHPWWNVQMRIHPNGWLGNSLAVISERAAG